MRSLHGLFSVHIFPTKVVLTYNVHVSLHAGEEKRTETNSVFYIISLTWQG